MIWPMSEEMILYYSSFAILGILFLTTMLFLTLFTGTAKKKKKRQVIDVRGRIMALHKELDKMLLEYLARKPDNVDTGRECKVNLYYALLANKENIDRVQEKVLNLSEIIKNENIKKIYKDIEIKTVEIVKALNESKGVKFVKDDIMPYLFIEKNSDKSIKILAMYEELSSLICKSKEAL